ncbi:hypothetical protein CpecG_0021 [Chlamydia pecorum MC/MarsBar]|nr:hypothetical protein CPE2_0725 [Chlamydia pecorum W73]AGW40052.1 hypothetical protein CPE3_0725 [Chlamydia pecorum P787]ETF38415.1 hypothetical protein CpecS_0023 [Chlamydia pecorum VR629]ETF38921.1 hypothetical protein CpecF_0021 [Chlamydia pecorum DBDeUG]ETF39597.1 hypothetical protein CpecG_0021 [Chlamydia pecorum MC/MarsBar]ETF40646.1 hypothetical protein CpecA_0021 [Chlamydia pecorum IPTaLE]KZN27236.1 hypothetical protein cpL17_0167 [Chlamydia pecorum]
MWKFLSGSIIVKAVKTLVSGENLGLEKEREVFENECNDNEESLDEEVSAYVLLTCGKASSDGKMQVEMTYEGDPAVISYLLMQAQDSLNES